VDLIGNGSDAVEKLSMQDYDVVLMDVQMPIMDGLNATRAIRQFLSLP
jgi:CheY-like chemotaxis protein